MVLPLRWLAAAIIGVFALVFVSRRRRGRASNRLADAKAHMRSLLLSRRSKGALISRIGKGSPAEVAGLQTGDVIIRFAGNEVRSSAELRRLVETTPDNAANVEVVRDGCLRSFVVIIAQPAPMMAPVEQPRLTA